MLNIVQSPESSIFQAIIDKDAFTAQHSIHVACLFKNMVSMLGLGINAQQAYIAGLLHDVGKINAPEVIFGSKSPLSPEEYKLVKRHPVDSFNLLKANNFSENICEIALLHHEREDGSGYPYECRYHEIPSEVKLFAIVDSFCAIVERRAYKDPVSVQKAVSILYESSGKYNCEMLNSYFNHLKPVYKITLAEMRREKTVLSTFFAHLSE